MSVEDFFKGGFAMDSEDDALDQVTGSENMSIVY